MNRRVYAHRARAVKIRHDSSRSPSVPVIIRPWTTARRETAGNSAYSNVIPRLARRPAFRFTAHGRMPRGNFANGSTVASGPTSRPSNPPGRRNRPKTVVMPSGPHFRCMRIADVQSEEMMLHRKAGPAFANPHTRPTVYDASEPFPHIGLSFWTGSVIFWKRDPR
jgi:hypothetical protein